MFRTAQVGAAGTPRYLAPEVLAGGEPTSSADVYAAAVMWTEVLATRADRFAGREAVVVEVALAAARNPDPGARPSAAALREALKGSHRLWSVRVLARNDVAPGEQEGERTARDPAREDGAGIGRAGSAVEERGAAIRPPADGSRVLESVDVPVYRPPRRRRGRIVRLVAGALGILAAAWLVGTWVAGHGRELDSVRAVTLSADPPGGQCPEAVFLLRATIMTDGRPGTVVLQWRRPDLSTTPPEEVSVSEGQTTTIAGLELTVTGTDPSDLTVGFLLIRPTTLEREVAITYTCETPAHAA